MFSASCLCWLPARTPPGSMQQILIMLTKEGCPQCCTRATLAALHAQAHHRAFAANSPPWWGLFTLHFELGHHIAESVSSTWGAGERAGSRPHPWSSFAGGGGVGSGIWILSSSDDSGAAGPQQDFPCPAPFPHKDQFTLPLYSHSTNSPLFPREHPSEDSTLSSVFH